ncbi:MAG: ABC transporter permease subunit [Chloroflexota bacterium]|nr:ABC transporter permease subunit [Chloroflexota bacterium]MDE2898836.1 ABC transporter permease subunit [Chloroflexota bacterium]
MTRLLYVQGVPIWRNVVALRWAVQVVSAVVVLSTIALFLLNVAREIEARDIPFGFTFVNRAAQIPIGEAVIPYQPSDSYWYGLVVAGLNTVRASVLGVILATAIGILVGVARLSPNWLLSRIALAYIEVFRNIPLIVQLLFWLTIVLTLPRVVEGYVIADAIFINNSGLYLPWFEAQAGFWPWALITAIGVALAVYAFRRLSRREIETGQPSYPLLAASVIAVGLSLVALLILGPLAIDIPQIEGRFGRLQGGAQLSGSFMALLVGLVIYTSAFIAEIVRAGIQSVGKGQTEAARSVGLSGMLTLRHVTFPQALRVIIPPLISQFLNLTKNSSLAAAIGYPDLVSVANTMTQIAPAISLFMIVMVSYLSMSLLYSLLGNLYNRMIRFKGA